MVRRPESEPIDGDERLGEAIEAYLALVEEGTPPDPDEFVARYPDLGDDLRSALDGLALVQGLVGEPSGPGHRLESGRRIAGYRVVRELGRGGMGTVYEAVHVGLDRPVALKVLGTHAAPDSSARRRFLNEARTAAGLHHTHIVPVFDVGQVGGLCYYAMQRIEGSGLDRVLRHLRRDRQVAAGSSIGATTPGRYRPASAASRSRSLDDETGVQLGLSGAPPRGPLGKDPDDEPPPYDPPRGMAYYRWVAEVGRQAAEALGHAHRRGVVHRDVKPSNLLVDARGVVWVADFGLARRLADPGLTHHDSLLGTPRYMSPEQARTGPVDGRTDVYSLGATLYELLTLRPPFEGKTAAELVEQIRDREPPTPRQADPRIPRDLETIVLKTLAKRPADRYATAAELAEDLQRFLNHEPVRARRIGPFGRAWRYARRHPSLTAVTTVAAATVLTIATTAYVRVVHARDQAKEALSRTLDANRKAQEAHQRTEDALRETRAAMRAQLLSRAQLVRMNPGLPNRRAQGLGLVQKAAAMDPEPELRAQLRDEAVELLVLRDVESRPELPSGPTTSLAFGHEGTRLATLSVSDDGQSFSQSFSLWDFAARKRLVRHPLSAGGEADRGSGRQGGGRPGFWRPGLAMAGEVLVVPLPGAGRLRLVDMATGSTIRDWDLNGGRVSSVLGVPGGGRLVTVESVPLDGGEPRRRPDGGEPRRRPDNDRSENQVHLYDLASLDRPIRILTRSPAGPPPQGGFPPLVAIAPDGETVATAPFFGTTVSLWSTADGEEIGTPIEAQAGLSALALGPDGLLAAASGGDIRLWEIGSATMLTSLASNHISVRLLRFNPQGTLLAVAGRDPGVEIWDPSTHTLVASLRMHDRAEDLAFSPDGQTLAVASPAPTSVWTIANPAERVQISGFDAQPSTLAFGADGRLAMGTDKGVVRTWQPGHCPSTTRQADPDLLPGVAADRKRGERAVSLAFDAQDRLLAVDSGTVPRPTTASPSPPSRTGGFSRGPGPPGPGRPLVARAAGGRMLFLAWGAQLLVWNAQDSGRWDDLQNGADARDGGGHDRFRRGLIFGWWDSIAASPAGDRLYLTARGDRPGRPERFVALEVEGGRARPLRWDLELPDGATCLAVSPDGATLALGDRKGEVILVDTARGAVRARLSRPGPESDGRISSVAFAPDGRELAVGTQQGQVELWSAADPSAPLLRLPGHRGFVSALAYDARGRHLASGGSDKLVEVWDLEKVRGELARLGLAW